MDTLIVRCPSVTYARKGQKVLDENGFACRLTRTGVHGCSWGLEIKAPDRAAVLRLLDDAGVIWAL